MQSCGVKKFIPEDELLYEGATLEVNSDTIVKDKAALKSALEQTLIPEPNKKFLGMRLGLYYYYKAQRENPGFLNRWLNDKFGEEPVYYSDVEPFEVEKLLINRLENRGFFYSTASSDGIEKEEKKVGSYEYTVGVREPYTMETYQLEGDSLMILNDLKPLVAETKFEKGMRFDLSAMKLERERLDRELKQKGYYNFNSNFLIFEADTNQYDNKRFDLYLRLKKDVPEKSLIPYTVKRINIYPNHNVSGDSIAADTVRFNDKNFIQPREELFFKPKRLDPYVLIEEGKNYNPQTSSATARRLSSIGVYKFVNIQYEELDTNPNDSIGQLEANIYLSPLTKRAVRAELQAVTKSNNFAGPNLALTYTNRNLFKGGEILDLTGSFGYEFQLASTDQAGLSSIQLGLGANLVFPRLLSPFNIDSNVFEYAIPKTKMGVDLEYISRTKLYRLLSSRATFGYIWQENRYVTHQLNPISINYVRLGQTSPEFEQILEDNPFLRESFNQRFISGLTYSFTYNGMVDQNDTHQFYVNSTFDTAGNSISLFASSGEGGEANTFLGLEYAQYAKLDLDVSYHFNFGKEQKLAFRLFGGYGLAYGNSEVVPYTKQYFSGGPYSVRAFRIRSLGPGTYSGENSDNSNFFDRTGNIRFEANAEYRFPIVNFLKGAVFVDAGNVWNSKENPELPGGKFSGDFLNELGMGTGFGLRIDIQSFVIRFDLAAPFHDPALPEGERFDFRWDEPIFNFAIGYPF
uniref:translocation and assembly module lipoprotein TamL n=1 Tax=Luteirhabdus pelagi TaxID=2792783 RepID=UPI0019392771|nr:BamA/TamA family outer membrane protein [Luteirhabdus pelagi]